MEIFIDANHWEGSMYRARKYLLMHRSGGRSQINRLCDLVTEAAGIMIMASILFILFSNNFCHSDLNTDERKADVLLHAMKFMANLLSLNQLQLQTEWKVMSVLFIV